MKNRDHILMCLATGGYVGKVPVAPGTFGTLAGLPLCYGLSLIPMEIAFQVVLIGIILSIWIADEIETFLNAKDPSCIVIDEIVGIMIAMLGIPFTVPSMIFAFVAFRFFDILKPFPVGYLDQRFSGGAGIVLDDMAAGIMANFLLRMAIIVF